MLSEKHLIFNTMIKILIYLVQNLFLVYNIMLLVRILSSWVPQWQRHKLILFVSFYTDPYLNIFRKIIPPLGMFDLSPIVAFLALGVLQNIIIALLLLLL